MPHPRFLGADPSPERRWQALRHNVEACYERLTVARGETTIRAGGVTAAYGHMTIAAVAAARIDRQLDRVLGWYRDRQPPNGAICWYLHPAPPGDLEARLFARGFAPNWQPLWMWCDLRYLPKVPARPSTFEIQIVADEPAWPVTDLPNYDPHEASVLAALHEAYPRHTLSLIAWQREQIVGRCRLNITTGAWGIAGLFDMGVVLSARNQGIGTALTRAACEHAHRMGCRHVMLNATPMGEPVYRRVGFQSMGYGHTWLLPLQTLAAPAPPPDRVRFLEAIGRGDIPTLDETARHLSNHAFDEPTPGGLTPLDIAVRCQQSASARWLVAHGVRLDPLSAWDLGWKAELPALLAEHPGLVNRQQGEWHATPLQIAIERGDSELAKVLLTVPNDLDRKDTVFLATAMEWAIHFQRTEIIALLQQHRSRG